MKFISIEKSPSNWEFYCWKKNYQKKKINKLIKKIEDSGDKDKLIYVKNLYRYYCIFSHLNNLVSFHPSFEKCIHEEDVKYHCLDLNLYLKEHIGYNTKGIIIGIIEAIANDEPLDIYYIYLMFRYNYEDYENYRKEMLKKNIWI